MNEEQVEVAAHRPVGAEGSLGPVVGAELGAETGSAGWPVSCAGTGAAYAGMQVGFLLNIHKTSNRINHKAVPAFFS